MASSPGRARSILKYVRWRTDASAAQRENSVLLSLRSKITDLAKDDRPGAGALRREISEIFMAQALRVFSRLAAVAGLAVSLAGCLGYEGVVNRGAVLDSRSTGQIKPGMPAQQVMTVLGTPSTTSTVGGDAWYYVSQRIERQFAFMPQNITDQRVYAVYFDKSKKVQRVADYGMEDGKPIDFITRTTPSAGPEYHLLQGMLSKVSNLF
jgi:outer membrane protein assembly factor BamE (lipoprotein component of BamABCDE complex)